MFFTLKLLKLALKLVLLPFRLVAKLFRWLVGFAVGRARGNASAASRENSSETTPTETTDPIGDPERENETPGGGGEREREPTASASAGLSSASSASTDSETRVGGQLLSPRGYAGVMGVLVAGQVLGVLGYTLDVVSLPEMLDPVWTVAATPLYDLVYYPFLWPDSVGAVYTAFAVGYAAVFGALAVQVLTDGYVPARFVRPVARFFAANGVLYAVMPVLIVWQVPAGTGFVDGLASFYGDFVVLYQTIAYGSSMGALYIATFQLRPYPSDVSGASAEGSVSTDQTSPVQTDADGSAAATENQGSSGSLTGADPSSAAEHSTDDGAPGPAVDATDGAEHDGAADETLETESASASAQQPVDATEAGDGSVATESAVATNAAAEGVPDQEGAVEGPGEGAEGTDTGTERTQSDETTNRAEAALGRLAADDADSRLAAASDLQDLAVEDHDYLTGDRIGEAVDDEPNPDVRVALVDALAALDSDAATGALRDARFDPNPEVSDRAAEHLD